MKKIIRKKHGELNLRNLKEVADAVPSASREEPTVRRSKLSQRKKSTSFELRNDSQARTYETKESKLSNLSTDIPEYLSRDSGSRGQHEEGSTSRNFQVYREKNFSETLQIGDVGSCTPQIFPHEKFESFEDSLEHSGENFQHNRADEETNFSRNLVKEKDFQYQAEILRLTDVKRSKSDFFRRSDVYYNESLFNEIIVMDSQEDDFVKSETNSPISGSFQNYKKIFKGLNKFITEKKQNKFIQNFPRTNFLKNNLPILTFFTKEKHKHEKKEGKPHKKENKNLYEVEEKFVDSEVTVAEDLQIKQFLFDFFLYILHLIVITTIALSMVSSNMYYFTDVTSSLFMDSESTTPSNTSTPDVNETDSATNYKEKTLRNARTFEDFWAFAESTLIQTLYWDFYYYRMDPETHRVDNDKKMFYENQILGVARLRQVRVRNDSCQIHSNVKRFFDTCYYYYSVFSEETGPIKTGMENSSTSTAWVYTEAKTLGSSSYWGEISIYGGGGYYVDLAPTKDLAIEMIKELKENFWLSRGTRAVFIDFNIYNANVNLFCLCKLVLEFPPVGGMIPKADFHSLKLIRYLSVLDFFILGCEFVYCLFVVYFTWKVVVGLIKQRIYYFFSLWNYLDLFILILAYIYIVLSFIRYFYAAYLISSLDDHYYEYVEFESLKEMQITYNNVIAILTFTCWMKLFMFFNFNRIMMQFRRTLERSLKDILGFFPMFLTMFLAFAFLAYLLFGNQVKDYNTVWYSFLSLLQAFLGEFNYHDIAETNQVLGPIFYIAFIFFIFFVLLNVFIAIINDAYSVVKSQVITDRPRTGEYLQRGFFNVCTCFGTRLKKKRILKDMKKKLLFKDLESALRKAGFSASEIKIFFYKYNINFNNFLGRKTKKKVIEDLELKRIDFSETSEQVQINTLRRRIDNLRDKMDNFEMSLQPIMDKVDILLKRPG